MQGDMGARMQIVLGWLSHNVLNGLLMEFCVLLRLVIWWLLSFILTCLINIEGRSPYLGDFVMKKETERKMNVGSFSNIFWTISFKFGMMRDTTEFWNFGTSLNHLELQGHTYMRKQNLLCSYFKTFLINLDEIYMLSQPFGLLKFTLHLFHMFHIQPR